MAEQRHKQRRNIRSARPERIAAMAALAAVLCSFGFAAGCSASTPQRAVGDFISARIAGDEARAAELTVEEELTGYIGGEPFLYATDVSFEIEQVETEVGEDRAVVIVHFRWDEQCVDLPYVSRRVGSKWKVALSETVEMWYPEIEIESENPTL